MKRVKERTKAMRGKHNVVDQAKTRSVPGVVYSAEGAPLSDAIVRLPALNRTTRTGKFGEFSFEIAAMSELQRLEVEAAGQEISIELNAVEIPIAIHFRVEV